MRDNMRMLPNELLQYEREQRDWSREYVAELIESPDTRMVGRWEREGVLPAPRYRQKLCDLFSKSARELGFVKPGEVPFWSVPYRRNPFFTGRETILTQLHELLTADKTAALTQPEAITGLGGIGKTQVALEYAYQYGDAYQAVLWARAQSRDVLTSDFAALATLLNLPMKDTSDQGLIIAAVKRWLAALSRWLLILDNVEDLQVIGEFLPLDVKGHVLLTTRSQATGPIAQPIEVEAMGPEEGALFLLRRAKIIVQDAPPDAASYAAWIQARQIVELMGGLPLALDQAGAYVEESRCSLAEYLALYQTRGVALLKERGGLAPDHPEAVVGTFLLSFEKVQQANPVAAELLRLCAFLAPDAIPEELITEGASELGPVLEQVGADLLLLNRAIRDLLRYSLVRRNPDAKILTIHRLVQAVLKNAMDQDTQRLWAERAARAVNRVFPEVEFSKWTRIQRFLPQALTCVTLIEYWDFTFSEAASLLDRTGKYLLDRAQYAQAAPLIQQALNIQERTMGLQHHDTAKILQSLALLYQEQGKYEQAESIMRQVLAIREKVLGYEHPDTAESFNDLGLLYEYQSKYEMSEPLLRRALTVRQKIHGPGHPEVARILNNLARLYIDQSKFLQAEPLLVRALEIQEHVFGPEHPEVAHSLFNLAFLYLEQGKYEQAETLYLRALAIRKKVLGNEHPDVAHTLNDLAVLYSRYGSFEQARLFYLQALSIFEKALGSQHHLIALIYNNLGGLYHREEKYEEAEPLFLQSIEIRKKVLGLNHPDTASSIGNLANLYRLQRRYEQAEVLFLQDLEIREKTQGPEHPEVARVLNNLANLYRDSGRLAEAEPLYKQALSIRQRVLGSDHPEVAACLEDYASLLRKMKRETEAREMELQAKAIRFKPAYKTLPPSDVKEASL